MYFKPILRKEENNLKLENLKEIPDFTGYYASKEGDIYTTLKKGCRDRYNLKKRITPIKMNCRPSKNGYLRVYLRRDSTNKREDLYVHRIIAELFIPNPNNLKQVNHKDCNRQNNNINNLEWVTQKENYEYALNQGFLTRDLKTGKYINKNKV